MEELNFLGVNSKEVVDVLVIDFENRTNFYPCLFFFEFFSDCFSFFFLFFF